MTVEGEWGRQRQRLAIRLEACAVGKKKTLETFADGPAVVAAGGDAVDLLPTVVADVAEQQAAVEAVEGEFPGVAEAEGEHLAAGVAAADKGVVGGGGIGSVATGGTAIDVESQHLAAQGGEILRYPRGPGQLLNATDAVTDAYVQHAIGAEGELAAVVEGFVGRDLQQNQLGGEGVHDVGIAAHAVLGDHQSAAFALGVADEEASVGGVVRVEGEAVHTLLALEGGDPVAEVEKRTFADHAILNNQHQAVELDHEQAPRAVAGRRGVDGLAKPLGDGLEDERQARGGHHSSRGLRPHGGGPNEDDQDE